MISTMPASPDADLDNFFMRRAIRLAMNGRGRVEPNPMVGCMIVSRDGRVIGEGYHEQYGRPHAEPNALASCAESPAGATAYVTLEPCCHTDKQTPPCAPRLIEAKVARVVIGCADPNPAVDGKGAAMLRAAGIRVDASAIEPACRQLIAPFVAAPVRSDCTSKRPYVTLKWAQTADGKVAGPAGRPIRITAARATRVVHQLRARCDAIMVGVNTVLTDDPMLTARDVEVTRPLLRVVLDRRLRTPVTARLVRTANDVTTVIICGSQAARAIPSREAPLDEAGVIVLSSNEEPCFRTILGALKRVKLTGHPPITHLLVEPGPTLASAFFAETDLVDRVWVFRSPRTVHAATAPDATPVPANFVQSGRLDLDGDTLTEYLNSDSPTYAATEPSADFALTSEEV
jgi:diaminohydroxyphosphoribosylaminopyrimidine deaminase / 5-amino-6-(5-phosphoribosylamino)uracil reductase